MGSSRDRAPMLLLMCAEAAHAVCAAVLMHGCLLSAACCLLVRRAKFQRRPLYQEHLGMNKLFDQDNVSGPPGMGFFQQLSTNPTWCTCHLVHCSVHFQSWPEAGSCRLSKRCA